MNVIISNTHKDFIPLTEYYIEDYSHKGLIFIQHGYQSTKEYGADYLGVDLARKGYFVVAIDAFKHGERIQEPYKTGSERERLDEAFIVVKRTALDIIRLHRNHYQRFAKFDMIGVSLGGMVAYYVATRTTKVRKLVPVISTPDFLAQAKYSVNGLGVNIEEYFTQDKLDFIASINPMNRLDKLVFEELFILCGTKDKVVPHKESLNFYNKYKRDGMKLKTYDIDHSVPRDMQLDIFAFIEK